MISAEEVMLRNAWRPEMRGRGPEIQAEVMRLLHEPRPLMWRSSDEIDRFRRLFGEVLVELEGSDPVAMLRCVRDLHARLKDVKEAMRLFPSGKVATVFLEDVRGIQCVMLSEAWTVASCRGLRKWCRDDAGRAGRVLRPYPIQDGHPFVLEAATWMMEEDQCGSIVRLIESGRLDPDAVERWNALDLWVEGCDDEAAQERFALRLPGSRTARLVKDRKTVREVMGR